MPTDLSEFEDDTAFERYVLDRATPLLPRVAGTSVIELGDGSSTSVALGSRGNAVAQSGCSGPGDPRVGVLRSGGIWLAAFPEDGEVPQER
jgi:hypothetical protein